METLQLALQQWIQSLTWTDLILVGALVLLEAALSADNAVALAALVKHLPNAHEQNRALRWGMIGAYGFRILIVLAATWLIDYQPARLLGSGYLLWLSWQHFRSSEEDESQRIPSSANFWQTLVLVELTDLVFSFDSIAASIAVSKKTWVIILGGILGITLMRYMASFFLRWLDEFERLEDAAYGIVALVGAQMMQEVLFAQIQLPEWATLSVVFGFFIYGFSKRELPPSLTKLDSDPGVDASLEPSAEPASPLESIAE